MELKEIRRANKVKVQDIGLDRRTVARIETGDVDVVSVGNLRKYLSAIGMVLTFSIPPK